MKRFVLLFLLLVLPARAAELTPVLMSNGVAKMVCDGQSHEVHDTWFPANKEIVSAYLFANLITPSSYGADVVIWSNAYGNNYPPNYANGPSSQWGSIADLHLLPTWLGGGRQGESYRSFQPDGIRINTTNTVKVIYICWGGGTIEIYAQIWVRDAN
jgi:hypothetical protein